MEQQGEKKKWVAPELVVLVRSHPEEAVLTGCKFFFLAALPVATDNECTLLLCGICSDLGES